jgi:polyadenylate-binding protein
MSVSEQWATLFVGDLSKSVYEQHLFDLFSKYGIVTHVEIKRDKLTLNNLGYGFVHFLVRLWIFLRKKG